MEIDTMEFDTISIEQLVYPRNYVHRIASFMRHIGVLETRIHHTLMVFFGPIMNGSSAIHGYNTGLEGLESVPPPTTPITYENQDSFPLSMNDAIMIYRVSQIDVCTKASELLENAMREAAVDQYRIECVMNCFSTCGSKYGNKILIQSCVNYPIHMATFLTLDDIKLLTVTSDKFKIGFNDGSQTFKFKQFKHFRKSDEIDKVVKCANDSLWVNPTIVMVDHDKSPRSTFFSELRTRYEMGKLEKSQLTIIPSPEKGMIYRGMTLMYDRYRLESEDLTVPLIATFVTPDQLQLLKSAPPEFCIEFSFARDNLDLDEMGTESAPYRIDDILARLKYPACMVEPNIVMQGHEECTREQFWIILNQRIINYFSKFLIQ